MATQQDMEAIMETTTLIEFEASKLSTSLDDVRHDCLSFEENDTQCTEEESDESSQSGNHFGHLKNVPRPLHGQRLSLNGEEFDYSWNGMTSPGLGFSSTAI
jgi:hypothetical protein